jgi:hypothetical protein
MTAYRVLWPYTTLKVRSDLGLIQREFYAGAPVPDNADPDDLERLIRKGAIVEEGTPEAELVAVPAGTPIPGEPPNVPVTEQPTNAGPIDERVARARDAAGQAGTADSGGRPKDYASKPEWVDWAVSQRPEDVSEEDARAQAEAKTKAELVTEYGG